ncbi:MAG: AI-2E family transporter [Verrucomicrobia bacterium]|nr:AI-2E family transporter [Verrucomicrobiota bacterium]MBV9297744.1 AI-2E family transporter [Verrucomicrobiota bacterium]MBV9645400.1 AI-2E family transporter [Verrucomicrobiota bacterium]
MDIPPVHPSDNSDRSTAGDLGKSVQLWFVTSVIGLFILGLFCTLKIAADLFLPIVLASFLGFLLTPVTRWLKKMGFSPFWAPLLGTLGFLIVLLCLFVALCASLARFEPEFPSYVDHVQTRLAPILQAIQKSSPAIRRLGDWMNPDNIPQVSISGPSFIERILTSAPNCLAILIVVHVLAFFFLLYGSRLQKRLVEMIPGLPEKQNVVEIASQIEQTASRYFSSVTLINASVGLSVWILVGLLGLPHPLLWGVAAFLLHYIPFVGATGGILAMLLVSLIHFESVWYALLPPLAYVFCAMIEGNLATPIVLGRWLTLNPIAIILTFLIWSYLWGVVGTLLAVPILATFKIFCDRIEPLKRLGSFLGQP